MAIRRFAARRGIPQEIYSDNGTNFQKANKELKEALLDRNEDEMMRGLALRGIQWKFNCPAAPHMGGIWERMVRTVKIALGASLEERSPREEILTTLLAEVEMIVNSRPLTHVSIDPNDLTCLTPNHFLIGEHGGEPVCPPIPSNICLKTLWRQSQQLADKFWSRWLREYVPTLVGRSKWTLPTELLKIGDLVVLGEENYIRGKWLRGRIVGVTQGIDGQVRAALVKTAHGTFKRPATKIVKLNIDNEESTS